MVKYTTVRMYADRHAEAHHVCGSEELQPQNVGNTRQQFLVRGVAGHVQEARAFGDHQKKLQRGT